MINTPKTARPLGTNQIACLAALRRHRVWPGGWIWNNHSSTVRLLDSLVKRGLASTQERTEDGPRVRRAMQHGHKPRVWVEYRITPAGEDLLTATGRTY